MRRAQTPLRLHLSRRHVAIFNLWNCVTVISEYSYSSSSSYIHHQTRVPDDTPVPLFPFPFAVPLFVTACPRFCAPQTGDVRARDFFASISFCITCVLPCLHFCFPHAFCHFIVQFFSFPCHIHCWVICDANYCILQRIVEALWKEKEKALRRKVVTSAEKEFNERIQAQIESMFDDAWQKSNMH